MATDSQPLRERRRHWGFTKNRKKMKQSPNRRSRSRNSGKRPGGRNNFESNGPDVKVRGTAQQVLEKYLALGRDATSSGDRIAAESYFQHAEHYYRIANADGQGGNAQGANQQGRRDRFENWSGGTGPQQAAAGGEQPSPEKNREPVAAEKQEDTGAEASPVAEQSEVAVEAANAESSRQEPADEPVKPVRRRRSRPKKEEAETGTDAETAPA